MERRKCYISYKFLDKHYRDEIVNRFGGEYFIDGSQQEEIQSNNLEYILKIIREKWLNKTTVTIFLIGQYSSEYYHKQGDPSWMDSQKIIRREIMASLYDGKGNTRNGLLGVVLPCMTDRIYTKKGICPCCNDTITTIDLGPHNVIKEFKENYFIEPHTNASGCTHYNADGEYAVLVKYEDFMKEPDKYIEMAFNKRDKEIAKKVKVRLD